MTYEALRFFKILFCLSGSVFLNQRLCDYVHEFPRPCDDLHKFSGSYNEHGIGNWKLDF